MKQAIIDLITNGRRMISVSFRQEETQVFRKGDVCFLYFGKFDNQEWSAVIIEAEAIVGKIETDLFWRTSNPDEGEAIIAYVANHLAHQI